MLFISPLWGLKIKREKNVYEFQDDTVFDIEYAILNLTPENYYRGIDPSGRGDFNVCAFSALVVVKEEWRE